MANTLANQFLHLYTTALLYAAPLVVFAGLISLTVSAVYAALAGNEGQPLIRAGRGLVLLGVLLFAGVSLVNDYLPT